MSGMKKPGRRKFLLGGLGVAGALIVGWGVMPPRQRLNGSHPLPVAGNEVALNGWIKIAADGSVTIAVHKSEMGQGIHTALQMMAAEELDVPLRLMKTMPAPMDKIYGNLAMLADGLPFHPDDDGLVKRFARWMTLKTGRELGLQVTGGSSSVKDAWQPVREASAVARAMLVAAAAAKWKVPVSECHTDQGKVLHSSGKSLGYGELAAEAVHSQPGQVTLKEPKNFRMIGHPEWRTDTPQKVNGSARFGIDARPEGLLYAAVRMSPYIGGQLKTTKHSTTDPGLLKLVWMTEAAGIPGVAALATSYWTAKKIVDGLEIQWEPGPNAHLSDQTVLKELAEKLDHEKGFTYYSKGDADAILDKPEGVKLIKAEYHAPFLAHAAMEPINCTAQFHEGRLDIWVSTQVPSLVVDAAAKTASIPAEKVTFHDCFAGGGFGRRLEVDMVVQAVVIAMQADGKPVKVIWSREEDIRHDMYRPAALARFEAALNDKGELIAYRNRSASGSVTQQVLERTFGLPGAGPDKTTAEGEFDLFYRIPHQKIAHVIVPTPVPLGYWRSVGHSHNAFFKESFIDELAHAAGKTPADFRRALLADRQRHLTVLDAALNKAGKAPEGRAHGLAFHQSFGTFVAEVAEVSVQDGEIRVHKVVCAVDCGIAVNPNIIRQQMESAVIFGLSAALFGEITIRDGQVVQGNFHDYPVLRMHQTPEIEVVIIPSAEPPEGIGEPGVPPVAPAVANALFQLTGKRLRSLPLRLS